MAIYKNSKNNTFYFRVYLTQSDGTKVQKQKNGFKTKREASNAEVQMILENERYLQNKKEQEEHTMIISFTELVENYKKYMKVKQKRNSYRCITNRIETHLLPYFKSFNDISKISAQDYIDWQTKIEEKNYTYSYKKNLHGAMVTLLNHAVKFYGLKENIASKVSNFSKSKDYQKNVNFWDYSEYQKFIKVVDNNLYKLLFETLYYTGMRLGECLALNWDDLNGNYISVCKTISKELIDGVRAITPPKTKSSTRNILIDDNLKNELLEYKKYCETKMEFKNSWFIFGDLTPLSPSTIERKKNQYIEKAEVKKIRIHDFRHSHASLLISRGVPITVVQNRLGHSDPNMTLGIYSHMLPNDDLKAVEAINAMNALRAS